MLIITKINIETGPLLQVATSTGHTAVGEKLLEFKADPNITSSSGIPSMHIAIMRGYFQVVQILLEAKANPNTVSKNGESPIHIASQYGQYGHLSLISSFKQ